jgi:hypothetical protein
MLGCLGKVSPDRSQGHVTDYIIQHLHFMACSLHSTAHSLHVTARHCTLLHAPCTSLHVTACSCTLLHAEQVSDITLEDSNLYWENIFQLKHGPNFIMITKPMVDPKPQPKPRRSPKKKKKLIRRRLISSGSTSSNSILENYYELACYMAHACTVACPAHKCTLRCTLKNWCPSEGLFAMLSMQLG